jgi:hypothetical protein
VKNAEELYAYLAGRTRTATDNAQTVRTRDWGALADIIDCNSAKEVYRLVERLLGGHSAG